MSIHSTENYSSDEELGQELIDILLRTGEIVEKSNYEQTTIRNDDQVKNDRYDELISAFNVNLEEILRQGNSRATSNDRDASNGLNHLNNDDDDEISKSGKCKNGLSSDPMNRCLSPAERELLHKVRALNQQLNSFIAQRNEPTNNALHDSIRRDRRHPFPHSNAHPKDIFKRQAETLSGPQIGAAGKSSSNDNAKNDNENLLSKLNNYGVPLQKFTAADEEDSNDSEDIKTDTADDQSNQPQTTPRSRSNVTSTGIRIPMRLVQRPNGNYYLTLDRRSVCSQCKKPKSVY